MKNALIDRQQKSELSFHFATSLVCLATTQKVDALNSDIRIIITFSFDFFFRTLLVFLLSFFTADQRFSFALTFAACFCDV